MTVLPYHVDVDVDVDVDNSGPDQSHAINHKLAS